MLFGLLLLHQILLSLKKNLDMTDFTSSADVHAQDAFAYLERAAAEKAAFGLIFMDPPFELVRSGGFAAAAAARAADLESVLSDGGLTIIRLPAKARFADGQRPAVGGFRLVVVPLGTVHIGEVVQRVGHVSVVSSEDLFANLQRPPVMALGLAVAFLVDVEARQCIHRVCRIGMFTALDLFEDGQ